MYWAQIEAVETLVWMHEVAPECAQGRDVLRSVYEFNKLHNDGLPRLASKMATGTGKTTVMAMIIAWHACNTVLRPDRYARQFVIMCHTDTIRIHLKALDPNTRENIFDQMSLVPRSLRRRVESVNVAVRTYQKFQRHNAFTQLGASKMERQVLAGSSANVPTEDVPTMLRRVLDIDFGSPCVIINDEAHHCYRPGSGRSGGETRKDRERAAMWFNAILNLSKEAAGLICVHDLSATPRFIEHRGSGADAIFPWTVSDFPLTDAIESGMVKIPRVPVSRAGLRSGLCRNVYENTLPAQRILDARSLPSSVLDPLNALYRDYVAVFEAWEQAGWPIPPVFIIVANTIENATELARYVSGHGDEAGWTPGHFDLFSNDPGGRLRTLLVHSNLDESDIPHDALKKLDPQLWAARLGRSGSGLDALREALDTVGKPDKLGAGIRCVISVSMLTEGWDAKNVTHIFGFRMFGTQLICEQVVGRALRRPDTDSAGWYKTPSYAEIFGVPFHYMLDAGNDSPPQSPGLPVRADVSPDADLEIRFPLVAKYVWIHSGGTVVSLDKLPGEKYSIPAEDLEGITGESKPIGVSDAKSMQDALWFITGTAVKRVSDSNNIDRGQLFMQLYPITARWVNEALNSRHHDPKWLCVPTIAGKIADQIIHACTVKDSGGDVVEPLPVVDSVVTTGNMSYKTTVRNRRYALYPTEKCSHTAAAFHTQLETGVATELERLSYVKAWMRNHPRIGWTIPYYHDDRWNLYQPDFVARLEAQGTTINCIIEAKGQNDDESRTKADYAQLWVRAINAKREYGKWAFVQIGDAGNLDGALSDVCRGVLV